MTVDTHAVSLDALVARLATTEDAGARLRLLVETARPNAPMMLAERIKDEADRVRYQDAALPLVCPGIRVEQRQ